MVNRQKGLNFYRKKKKISSTTMKEIASWFFCISITIFLAFVFVFAFGMKTSIIGVSMEPNLYNGQEILISRFAYQLTSPKRGDVIVFLPNGNKNTHYYAKRVVALPGETVQIKEGKLYVNGILQEKDAEKYDKMADAGITENGITLGYDEYFVLGDNRNSSEDSRSGNIGSVKKDVILGKAWFHLGASGKSIGFVK